MKKITLTVFCAALLLNAPAQNLQEWTQQKKMRLSYLMQQILANETFRQALSHGYSIAKEGISLCNKTKQGDFGMHSGRYQKLRQLNPLIGSIRQNSDIAVNENRLLTICRDISSSMNGVSYTSEERDHIGKVLTRLLNENKLILDRFGFLENEGILSMEDADRLKETQVIGQEIIKELEFLQQLAMDLMLLSVQRSGEKTDIDYIKKLYGL